MNEFIYDCVVVQESNLFQEIKLKMDNNFTKIILE